MRWTALGFLLLLTLPLLLLPTSAATVVYGCVKMSQGPVHGACFHGGTFWVQAAPPTCTVVWRYHDPEQPAPHTMYECTGPELYEGKVCISRWYSYSSFIVHVPLTPDGPVVSRTCVV